MNTFWENLVGIFTNANFYFAVIRVTAPILFATLGCAIAEKAGSTNMGMEGIMLVCLLSCYPLPRFLYSDRFVPQHFEYIDPNTSND